MVSSQRAIFKRESSIFTEPDGPSIPIIDYNKGQWLSLWYEYVWARGVADQVTFLGRKVMDFQVRTSVCIYELHLAISGIHLRLLILWCSCITIDWRRKFAQSPLHLEFTFAPILQARL